MPEIEVEIKPGEFAPFQIDGEEPTYVEMRDIQKLVRKMDREANIATFSKKSNEQFDTTTGITDS